MPVVPETELEVRLLSIFNGIDETCRKVGSRLQLNAAGEVYFFDSEDGPYKFQTYGLPRRSEMLAAIRDGWTPCGFIVCQMAAGRSELHVGTFSWAKTDGECTRYVEERLIEFMNVEAPAEAVYKNLGSS